MRLTSFLYGSDISHRMHKKVDLWEVKANAMKQEMFVWTEINYVLGKNGGRKPSGLGCRSIVVVSE